jgi:hypothetical protein
MFIFQVWFVGISAAAAVWLIALPRFLVLTSVPFLLSMIILCTMFLPQLLRISPSSLMQMHQQYEERPPQDPRLRYVLSRAAESAAAVNLTSGTGTSFQQRRGRPLTAAPTSHSMIDGGKRDGTGVLSSVGSVQQQGRATSGYKLPGAFDQTNFPMNTYEREPPLQDPNNTMNQEQQPSTEQPADRSFADLLIPPEQPKFRSTAEMMMSGIRVNTEEAFPHPQEAVIMSSGMSAGDATLGMLFSTHHSRYQQPYLVVGMTPNSTAVTSVTDDDDETPAGILLSGGSRPFVPTAPPSGDSNGNAFLSTFGLSKKTTTTLNLQ